MAMPEAMVQMLMTVAMFPVLALTTVIFYLYACAAWVWTTATIVNRKKGSAEW
jgi:hypothetical protein